MTLPKQPIILSVPALKGSIGLFISLQGECFVVEKSHIQTVISNPGKFGITAQEIEAAYAKHCEPVGVEGLARDEILRGLIAKGWIRLRRYIKPREQWSATVAQLDERTRALLREWAAAILTGTLGCRENDPLKPVVITALSGGIRCHAVETLARGNF
jgi:hypothetical protein